VNVKQLNDPGEISVAMTTVLITAFRPYGPWEANASWLTLVELTKDLPDEPEVITRLYPVDFAAVRQQLEGDLAENFDVVLHLGQAPGVGDIRIESIGINVGAEDGQDLGSYFLLDEDGPVAYRSRLPLVDWAGKLREAGFPAAVSHHAGTYLCNATLYWTHHIAERDQLTTRAAFIHVPLDPCQLDGDANAPSLPAIVSARAVRVILDELA
jgi:pyroglutamyl-peptidase